VKLFDFIVNVVYRLVSDYMHTLQFVCS